MSSSLVIANWKMNGSVAFNEALLEELASRLKGRGQVVICVPYVYLAQAKVKLSDSGIDLGAQDVSSHVSGAFTGEISAGMLTDVGCSHVIVGHSERREYHAESDQLIAAKYKAALGAGLRPVVCVGETLEQREAGKIFEVISSQLQAVLDVASAEELEKTIFAYEPVWAIGTGLTASPVQAQEVHAFIRQQLPDGSAGVPLLYGGSVKPQNAAELFSQQDIDGGLIGGASLLADDFVAICQAVS